jgi:beta-lactamase class A
MRSCVIVLTLAAVAASPLLRRGLFHPFVAGQSLPASGWNAEHSPPLQAVLDTAVRTVVNRFAARGLRADQVAATLVDLRDETRPSMASVRGDVRIYPASVVKLFYLAAAERWIEDGRLAADAEFMRALHDMIVDSSNDATAYVLDALTETSSGPPLGGPEMAAWSERRNVVNRYFASLGYRNINVNHKTWCEGPYGRDQVFLGPNRENRNALTTDATARLLAEIVTGRAVTPARSSEMRALLARDRTKRSADPDDQATGFSGSGLPPGAKLWSKAGWTSNVRHDAAYVELPSGARIILVTFTTEHSDQRDIVPAVVRAVIERLRQSV